MVAYDPAHWSDLFVATAGSAAALAGLVFVAVSINIERILQLPGVPDRALQTVMLLLSVVSVSIVGLIPGQGHVALGIELIVVEALFGAGIAMAAKRSLPSAGAPRSWAVSRFVVVGLGTTPLLIGGISVLALAGGGLYWTAAGIVGAITGAVANAWVLLVEILR